jgi:hypothetical protein
MKISYPTILVTAGLFSAIAIASFSKYRKGSQRKELQNEHKDKPKYTSSQNRYLVKTTAGTSYNGVKSIATEDVGLEGKKVRRVRKYKSDGKPVYE